MAAAAAQCRTTCCSMKEAIRQSVRQSMFGELFHCTYDIRPWERNQYKFCVCLYGAVRLSGTEPCKECKKILCFNSVVFLVLVFSFFFLLLNIFPAWIWKTKTKTTQTLLLLIFFVRFGVEGDTCCFMVFKKVLTFIILVLCCAVWGFFCFWNSPLQLLPEYHYFFNARIFMLLQLYAWLIFWPGYDIK